MKAVYLCDYIRTPIGRYGGGLSSVRTDTLASLPIKALMERNEGVDWALVDDVYLGCVNQAGEDSGNVGRSALLLAGLPQEVPGATINRLCGSGMNAVVSAAHAIAVGAAELIISGGVENMSRAPFVIPKAHVAFSRETRIEDSTMGPRFPNPEMKRRYGCDPMSVTAENVAERFGISREDQDLFALRSHRRASFARQNGRFAQEIVSVEIPQRKGDPRFVSEDEHIRPETTIERLAKLPAPFVTNGTVTAGNASGLNDGAAAMIVACEAAIKRHGLRPRARFLASAIVGVEPRIMGIGPVPATQKLCQSLGLIPKNFDTIELNEAFAAQALAVLRQLGLADEEERVNPNGGAIALGHPLGMSGARIVGTAALELERTGKKRALATMCIGAGQGVAVALERV